MEEAAKESLDGSSIVRTWNTKIRSFGTHADLGYLETCVVSAFPFRTNGKFQVESVSDKSSLPKTRRQLPRSWRAYKSNTYAQWKWESGRRWSVLNEREKPRCEQ